MYTHQPYYQYFYIFTNNDSITSNINQHRLQNITIEKLFSIKSANSENTLELFQERNTSLCLSLYISSSKRRRKIRKLFDYVFFFFYF